MNKVQQNERSASRPADPVGLGPTFDPNGPLSVYFQNEVLKSHIKTLPPSSTYFEYKLPEVGVANTVKALKCYFNWVTQGIFIFFNAKPAFTSPAPALSTVYQSPLLN